ncbi:uncharacterized protein J7T54_006472 [Emericellopsis cladophorae]|uniref:Uncharacterized protein n=1 Tax=Emericellopsis cladophorae TaxID=2686198 RepID=A0A9Q0BFW5_9HYPO|nr:uncharacterized protein J7T54_006472 [Emericellopsis cladophorae]KAI6784427.1 hypothetical protein J7T54_006472 [Emericellopsis cladophorae]
MFGYTGRGGPSRGIADEEIAKLEAERARKQATLALGIFRICRDYINQELKEHAPQKSIRLAIQITVSAPWSPPRQPVENYRSRDDSPPRRYDGNRTTRRERRFSSVSKGSRDSRPRHRDTSRSPDANRPRYREDKRESEPQRDNRAGLEGPGQQRERSLSPFSKRVALTRSRAP